MTAVIVDNHFATDLDLDFLEDVALPCDNADASWCPKLEAGWRAHVRCPECGGSRWELWCTPCKDLVMSTEDGFECGGCGAYVFPARRFVAEFLPMER